MWDMYEEPEDDVRITGLQPDRGAFPSRKHALASFVRHEDGWSRHREGFIIFHTEDCVFGDSGGDECSCKPYIVAPMSREDH
jgi:hypothetical protein